MNKLFNFLINDIPNKERVRQSLLGASLLSTLLLFLSILPFIFDLYSFGWMLIIGFSPFIIYFGLYLDVFIKYLLIGIIQLFYSKIYGWHNKNWTKK